MYLPLEYSTLSSFWSGGRTVC